MNGKNLLEDLSYIHLKYVDEAEGKFPQKQKRTLYFKKKPLLVAAIIATAAFLMGAAINALISMRVEDVMVHIPIPETQVNEDGNIEQTWTNEWHEGERINFDEVQDVFIELGSYYPQEIPEGYEMVFVSDSLYQQQYIAYEDDAGNGIDYMIYIPDEASNVEIYDIVSKSTVIIQGHEGFLYEETNGYRTLVWTDGRQGYGFKLRTGDVNVDLLAMARSVGEGEFLTHSRVDKTEEAVLELGNFSPTYLPVGFEEKGMLGSPIADGGGWYSYVRKWYVDRGNNLQIYFEYETYAIDTESGYLDDAKTICSFWIPGCDIMRGILVGDEIEINGMYGIATDKHIAWADPETHRVFHLTSEDITGTDLLKVAQSIQEE